MVALPPYQRDIVPLVSRFSHREPPQLIKINTAESVCIADPAVFYYACALLSPFLARIFCFILFEFCIKKSFVNNPLSLKPIIGRIIEFKIYMHCPVRF